MPGSAPWYTRYSPTVDLAPSAKPLRPMRRFTLGLLGASDEERDAAVEVVTRLCAPTAVGPLAAICRGVCRRETAIVTRLEDQT